MGRVSAIVFELKELEDNILLADLPVSDWFVSVTSILSLCCKITKDQYIIIWSDTKQVSLYTINTKPGFSSDTQIYKVTPQIQFWRD